MWIGFWDAVCSRLLQLSRKVVLQAWLKNSWHWVLEFNPGFSKKGPTNLIGFGVYMGF